MLMEKAKLSHEYDIELVIKKLLEDGAPKFNFYWYWCQVLRQEFHSAWHRLDDALVAHGFLTTSAFEACSTASGCTTPVITPETTSVSQDLEEIVERPMRRRALSI
jgi:hypothetical protein